MWNWRIFDVWLTMSTYPGYIDCSPTMQKHQTSLRPWISPPIPQVWFLLSTFVFSLVLTITFDLLQVKLPILARLAICQRATVVLSVPNTARCPQRNYMLYQKKETRQRSPLVVKVCLSLVKYLNNKLILFFAVDTVQGNSDSEAPTQDKSPGIAQGDDSSAREKIKNDKPLGPARPRLPEQGSYSKSRKLPSICYLPIA